MLYQCVFKRYEVKYILTLTQAESLKVLMREYMNEDQFGNCTICNIYLDTPDYLLIRRSLDKPVYKEKIRFRSYGIADEDTKVFCELKKKYNSIVYKRRFSITENELICCDEIPFPKTQIGKEISYCFTRYSNLLPRVFLSYDREAYYATNDNNFRMTFDKNIIWRDYDLSLTSGIYGNRILEKGFVLLEVKTAGAIPLWLVRFLSKNKIYKTSFSKYGNAYLAMKNYYKKEGAPVRCI